MLHVQYPLVELLCSSARCADKTSLNKMQSVPKAQWFSLVQKMATFFKVWHIFIIYKYSVASGNQDIFDLLVNSGATCQPAGDGRTILMQAASRGDLKFIDHILDNARKFEVLVNEKDVDGWNSLFYTLQGKLYSC